MAFRVPTLLGVLFTCTMVALDTLASADCPGLGLRQFEIAKPPSAFLASPVGGSDISGPEWLASPLPVCAGPVGSDGLYPLSLEDDVVLGVPTLVPGLVACLKVHAAGSSGMLDCDGGTAMGVNVTQNSRGAAQEGPPHITTGLGAAGRAGEAMLLVDVSLELVSDAASVSECLDVDFQPPVPVALTTADGSLTINEPLDLFSNLPQLDISGSGEPFSCATWTDPGSAGVLVAPMATLDMPIVGDAAAILRLGSEPEETGPACTNTELLGPLFAAGNTENEKERYLLLAEYAASLDAGDPLLADLQALLPVIDQWANGREKYWQPGEQALNASGYLANFFDLKATPGSDYPPAVPSDSPVCPLWAMYRGRMLIQQTIQTAFILNDANLRQAYFGEGRELLDIAATAFPDNRVLRMWLDEPIPWAPLAADPGAPPWANLQREALEKLHSILGYWIDERQAPDGQFGGGWTDDVEMWRLWTPLLVGFGDDRIAQAQRLLTEGMFNLPRLEGGYTSILTDTEHSSEETGDTITSMLLVDPDDPDWRARAARLAELMREVWGDYNERGFLQFQSNYYTSAENSPDPDFACDTPYHSRTLQPALLLWQRTGDEDLTALFTEWLDTWVDATAREERGKPAGVVPAAIHWPSGEAAGPEAHWWSPGCATTTDRGLYNWPSQVSPKLLSLLLAYRVTGDARYLEPIESMVELRRAYLAAPDNSAPTGSAQWVGRRAGGLLSETLAKYRTLTGDTRFDDLVTRDSSEYMKYRLSGDTAALIPSLQRTVSAFRVNREAYTSEVRWTDRIFRFPGNYANYYADPKLLTPSVDVLYRMLTGDPGNPFYLPLNAVRWDTQPDDFAALVEASGPRDFVARLYHFGEQGRSMGARFLLLDEGHYRWQLACEGEELASGAFDTGAPAASFELPPRRECRLTVVASVRIEIKSGGVWNILAYKRPAMLPVIVYGSQHLAVQDMDAAQLRFGPLSALPRDLDAATQADSTGFVPMSAVALVRDLDQDGYADAWVAFEREAAGIEPVGGEACINCLARDGGTFEGCDEVAVLPALAPGC